MKYEQVEFLVKQFGQRVIATDTMLEAAYKPEVAVDTMLGYMYDRWSLCFKKYVPTKELANHRYPTTWVDAFRARWFPSWWLKRWPARYTQVTVDMVIPHSFPSNSGVRFVMSVDGELDASPPSRSLSHPSTPREAGRFGRDSQDAPQPL